MIWHLISLTAMLSGNRSVLDMVSKAGHKLLENSDKIEYLIIISHMIETHNSSATTPIDRKRNNKTAKSTNREAARYSSPISQYTKCVKS